MTVFVEAPERRSHMPMRAAEAIAEHERLIDAVECHSESTAGRVAHDHMGRALEIRVMMLDPRGVARPFAGDIERMRR